MHCFVVFSSYALKDIERIPLSEEESKSLQFFLEEDGCRIINKRQQQINAGLDIWYFRLPILGRGSRGGGRTLYYRQHENNICIHRIFNKKEIDNDGKKRGQEIWNKALSGLEELLRQGRL